MKTDGIERIVELTITGLLVAGLGIITAINYNPNSKKILDDYSLRGKNNSSIVDEVDSTDNSLPMESSSSNNSAEAQSISNPIESNPLDIANPPTDIQKPIQKIPHIDEPQTELININDANLEQLQQLDGIGKVKAQAIIDYRETHGAFLTVDELTRVDGIGEKTLEKNRDRITV